MRILPYVTRYLDEQANIKFKAGEYSQANEVRFTIFLVHSLVDI